MWDDDPRAAHGVGVWDQPCSEILFWCFVSAKQCFSGRWTTQLTHKNHLQNTKGHLISVSKEDNPYSVRLQSLLEHYSQLPKCKMENILQEWPCPVLRCHCLMSECAPERHRVPTVTFGQQELTTSIMMRCSVPLPCWCDSGAALSSTRGRFLSAGTGAPGSPFLQTWAANARSVSFCTESSSSQPCFHLAPPINPLGICSRRAAKNPSWDHSPLKGRILQQVVKDKEDGVCVHRSKAGSVLPVCVPWAPICSA